jgi:outer membrane protein assembly factor BamB
MSARPILAIAVFLGGIAVVGADEWPQFRGPGSTGVAAGQSLPLAWGADKNVAWKAKLPGVAWSSPIVWGDKVFLTTAVTDKQTKPSLYGNDRKKGPGKGFPGKGPPGRGGPGRGGPGGFGPGGFGGKPPDVVYRWHVYCLERASGKVIWDQVALRGKPRIPTQQSNTYATETPVTDGRRVYAYFGMHGLFCYDLSGKLLWKKDLGAYPTDAGMGTASSPTIDGERLFLQIDNEQKSFLVALDGRTGDELWRAARDERTSYSSPVLWKNRVRTELVAAGSNKVRSYDPATGKVLWELSLGGGRCAASPVGDAERLYVGADRGFGGGPRGPGRPGGPGGGFGGPPGGGRGGRGGGLFAVRAGASGDLTPQNGEMSKAGIAWHQPAGSLEMASPLAYQGHLYVLSNRGGLVTCYDTTTGKQVYRERLPDAQSFWASPWAAGGKVFCLDQGGTTYVLQAGPQFKLLAENRIDDQFWATPAIAGDSLILRGVANVYCIKQ